MFTDNLYLKVIELSRGDMDTFEFVVSFCHYDWFKDNVDVLVENDIVGPKLGKLWYECCMENERAMILTLRALKEGIYTYDDIHLSLSQLIAIPFVDICSDMIDKVFDESISMEEYLKESKEYHKDILNYFVKPDLKVMKKYS
jgi:hypothetical protein